MPENFFGRRKVTKTKEVSPDKKDLIKRKTIEINKGGGVTKIVEKLKSRPRGLDAIKYGPNLLLGDGKTKSKKISYEVNGVRSKPVEKSTSSLAEMMSFEKHTPSKYARPDTPLAETPEPKSVNNQK
jgi:hypothetical protein